MDYLNAFLCGGILCAIGQLLIDKTTLTPARILTGYVVAGVLLSALGANIHGRRTAFVYLLIDVLGVIIWATVFYVVNAFVHFSFMPMTMTTVSIALLNTLFRLATVIVLTPCIGLLERFVCFLIPDKRGADPAQLEMDRLEERFLQHPALLLSRAGRSPPPWLTPPAAI